MNPLAPRLPSRATKPRSTGLTMVIDGGIPLKQFADIISSTPELIDFVKFGWGTAIVTGGLQQKIDVLREHGIGFYLGGTLFEKYVMQERFDDYKRFCVELGCEHVEVSNGTVMMSNAEKASYIRKLAGDFTVVSEVGFKDPDRSEQLPPSKWVEYINEDLAAGATMVTLEARESGKSGICRPDGALRFGLIEDVLSAGVSQDQLLFEAPTTTLQTYFITRLGTDVNLGNVPASAVIGLETLRLGLRADTLTHFA
ncbi:MAG TPA: phosphosulfolactate synthase [Streptosporangiaceae bacterium]|nr:phosphosulfolactate synthase [Streptosporangiaceae bacterium]